MAESETPPNLYVEATLKHMRSLGDAGIAVLEQSGRRCDIVGEENVPSEGGFIVVINHFVRVDNPEDMTGNQKMNDMFGTIGAITKIVRAKIPSDRTVIWTPSQVARPEALWPKGASRERKLEWLRRDAKFAFSNIIRSAYLSLIKSAKDVVSVPSGYKGLPKFVSEITGRLAKKDVLALFPEGEVSVSMREAKSGFAHLSRWAKASVLPVSVYDQDGTLRINISPPVPALQTEGHGAIKEYENRVMHIVAANLPESLRGFYRESTQ